MEKSQYAQTPTVSAAFANNCSGEYDSVILNDAEYAADVVFTTDGTVGDFTVYSLMLEEITDDGRVSFLFDKLYKHGDLTPERGLALKMNLPETIPFYGISYTDGTGAVNYYSVNLSGFDGSVYLAQIEGTG